MPGCARLVLHSITWKKPKRPTCGVTNGQYLRLKKQYDEAFVPQVIVVQHKGKLLRTAHLTKPCNYSVPPVDCFFLQTNGVVPAEVVMKFCSRTSAKSKGTNG